MIAVRSVLRPAGAVFLGLGVVASIASGYTGNTVSGGGAVSGTVTAPGAKALAPVKVSKDVQVCSATHQPETIVVGKDGALANVVVYLKDISSGKPLPAPGAKAALDQKGCTFVPHVSVVPVGSQVMIHNNDNVLHNVHAFLGTDTVFNVALPIPGMQLPQTMKKPGVVSLKCDAGHTWMAAYIHVVDHPYYAVTDAAGKFDLKEVPAGTYTLVAWHESFGTQEQKVTVAGGKASAATFTFAAK